MFYQATGVTELPELDFSNCTATLTNLFYGCTSLKTMTLKIKETIAFANTCFTNCTALENIGFNGKLGASLDIHWSTKLSYDSASSIFDCLGGTDSATLTLPKSHDDGRYDSLIADKMPPNWAVSWL